MSGKPLFFRDEGGMGDILEQARGLTEKIELQSRDIDEFKDELEETINKETINQRIGNKIIKLKKSFSDFAEEWKAKRSSLNDSESELRSQQKQILSEKAQIEQEYKQSTTNQEVSAELERLNQLSVEITEKLDRIESTKETIDRIIADEGDEIKENILSRDDVEFLSSNYFNLVKSRILSEKIIDPLTGEEYLKDDLNIENSDHSFIVKFKKGIFKKSPPLTFDVRLLIPEDEEGYIYKKAGNEYGGLITDFVNTNDFETYNVLVLASPTGWNDKMKTWINSVISKNQSIVLADLSQRQIFTNNNDASKQVLDLFSPISKNEEIQEIIELLHNEINEGAVQFRADKVSNKYQISKKLVIDAFKSMEKSEIGEIIGTDEGAKDLIFLTR